MSKRRNLASDLAQARLQRIKGGGVNGAQASSIGLTLVGCIIAGAGAGWWLDNRFGTQIWTPILFLVGVAAGFRQMMATIRQTNAFDARRREENRVESEKAFADKNDVSANVPSGLIREEEKVEPARTRVFRVPAPPIASFDGAKDEAKTDAPNNEYSMSEVATSEVAKEDYGLRAALAELEADKLEENEAKQDDRLSS